MAFAGDRRAQSVQVGVIVLFGFLLLAYSGYQATVVPQQNERVEFEHSDRVQADMTDLRSAILDVSTRSSTGSVSVKLGTTYPSRSIFLNPNPPTGRLSTVDTTDESVAVSVEHAESPDEEVGDFWNGDERSYNTGGLAYQPFYNYYDESAPVTAYENTVLYNRYPDTDRPVSGQVLVDGREIRLVTLNGSTTLEGFRASAVDVRGVSASDTRISVTNESSERVTVVVPTTLSESKWEEILAGEIDGSNADPDAYVHSFDYDGATDPATVTLEFEQGVQYDLSLARVGVGSGVADTEATYSVDVQGDGATIVEGADQRVVVEVRDEFNNPVSGVQVSEQTPPAEGDVVAVNPTTDSDGRAVFRYEAPADVTRNREYSFTLGFDTTPEATAEFAITVQDTGGGNTPPTADFEYSPTNPSAGEDIDFDGSLSDDPDGSIVSYEWDWTSDGSYDDTGETATHSYGSNGDYDVTLRVTDDQGATDTETKRVTVGSGGGGDTTPPTMNTLTATAEDTNGDTKNAEQVTFDYDATDSSGVDEITFEVFDPNGNSVGFSRVTADSGTETVVLDAPQDMNGNSRYLDVEVVATDTEGNERVCTGRIQDTGQTITKADGEITC